MCKICPIITTGDNIVYCNEGHISKNISNKSSNLCRAWIESSTIYSYIDDNGYGVGCTESAGITIPAHCKMIDK